MRGAPRPRLQSKWTCLQPVGRDRHYEIVALSGGNATLRCVVSRAQIVVDLVDLHDPSLWQVGWLP